MGVTDDQICDMASLYAHLQSRLEIVSRSSLLYGRHLFAKLEDYHLCLFQASDHDSRGTFTVTTPSVNSRAFISQRFVVCSTDAHP